MAYQQVTQNGYNLSEVVSALQKEIRRGNEKLAYFWAHEMCPHYEKYLWRRLLIIVHEDIGIANPLLLILVPCARETYFDLRSHPSGGGVARLALANVILLMCRTAKTRLAVHLDTVVEQERRHGQKLEVPDYALDKHTQRGRGLKRGYEHFFTEAAKLVPMAMDVPDPYAQAAKDWYCGPNYKKGEDWEPTKAKKKGDMLPLFDEDDE